jgi:hypothetical protein
MPHDGKPFRANGHAARPAAAGGLSPLEVLLSVMRHYFERGQLEKAARVAKDAAPYVHARVVAAPTGGPGAQVNLLTP